MAIASESKVQKIPDFLIKEVIDGKPVYYKGYKEVLANKKKPDDIMGCSGLQAEIISYLLRILFSSLDATKYRIYTNEVGSHLAKKKNYSSDIAIFDKSILTADKIDRHYPVVPPKIVFEIDLDIELEDLKMTEVEYVLTKTQQLLEFGVEKIFWITTKTKKVSIAESDKKFAFISWDEDIELLDSLHFNIGRYLKEEGIEV